MIQDNRDIYASVSELYRVVKRDAELVSKLGKSLRGPLQGLFGDNQSLSRAKREAAEHEKRGKRWVGLVNEVQNGCGEYAVEALLI